MRIVLAHEAQQALKKLDLQVQRRIIRKLEWYEHQKDPLSFAEPLTGTTQLFRFRVGAYRIFVRPDGTVLTVLRIRKRSEAYR